MLGQQSLAYELWEQLGNRSPDWYIVPVGQGIHLLGVWLGFKRLFEAGLTQSIPRMVAVQAALLAPLCQAYDAGLDSVPGVEPSGTSLAEGLAIAEPVRGRRLLQAIRESNGTCVMAEEDEIRSASRLMAMQGFYIEPTSATVIAGLHHISHLLKPGETVVIPLTGSGLKGTPKLG
jgi:threonine synthase